MKFNFLNFDPIPLPLDPEVKIRRIIPEKIRIFKVEIFFFFFDCDYDDFQSAKLPFLLVCETTEGDEYPVIFKYGDDLRQDQLILQMITLMDRVCLID